MASAYANGHVTHTEPVDEKGKQKQQTYMYEAGKDKNSVLFMEFELREVKNNLLANPEGHPS